MKKLIEKAVSEVDVDGIVNETLKENIKKTIKDTIDDLFSWNGPLKELIKTKVKEEMNVNLDHINFQDYSHLIEDTITETINNVAKNQVTEKTEGILLVHKHIKPTYDLAQIIDEFVNELESNDDGEFVAGSITVGIEDRYYSWANKGDYRTVKINREDNDDSDTNDEFQIEIELRKNLIHSLKCDSKCDTGFMYDLLEKIYKLGMNLIVDDSIIDKEFYYSNRDY